MRINNNIPALKTFRKLESTNKALNKSIRALSTGLRINSAADDAAGFAISEKMRSQISGLDIALKNSQDGISFLQTAEGALGDVNSILQRMRELSVQASNDSLTSNDRQFIQLEIDELKSQINQIAGTTQFNRKRLLDGSSGALWSSSDLNVKARINGGLTYTDNFGQKVSSEGNYKIEVSTDPGQAQVQKTNIFTASYEERITKTETVQKIIGYTTPVPYEININTGLDTLGATSGDGWNFSNGVLTITGNGKYCIVGDTTPTTNHIVVNPGVNATIFLRDVNIDMTNSTSWGPAAGSAFFMQGADVDMYLDGNNTLVSGGMGHSSGIEVSGNNSKLTISSIAGDFSTSGTLTTTGSYHGAVIGGSCTSGTADSGEIIIKGGTIIATGGDGAAGIGGGNAGGPVGGIPKKILIEGGNITANGGLGGAGIGTGGSNPYYAPSTNDGEIIISGGTVTANGGTAYSSYLQGAGIGGGSTFDSGHIEIGPNASVTTTGYIESGQSDSIGIGEGGSNRDVPSSTVTPSAARTVPSLPMTDPEPITQEESTVTETITTKHSTLADISRFYDPSGKFLLNQPETITITQGNGQSANVTLDKTDTIYDVAGKINDAIANKLGQAKYTDNLDKFCTIADGTANTSESVFDKELISTEETEEEITPSGSIASGTITTTTNGYNVSATMLVRSAIPGKMGELTFSGDEDLLNALGLNTIQESSESTYTANVYNAHTGQPVAVNVKSSEPEFKSLIPPEIDIRVDLMAGLKSNWNEATKAFMHVKDDNYSAFIHLSDNTTIFQTGSNEGEDFIIQLGDTSTFALGIDNINLLTRENASRSIGILDRAINRVSTQRAKVGAFNNALEHVINNLTTTSANLSESESRIRDVDFSQEYMNFIKWQILNQSGTSMLAQANQTPQSVLSLLQ